MNALQNTFQRLTNWPRPSDETITRAAGISILGFGVVYMMVELFNRDFLAVLVFLVGWLLLFALVNSAVVQARLLGERPLNVNHLLHIVLYWLFSPGALLGLRLMLATDATGKDSRIFYILLLAFICFTLSSARSLWIVTDPRAYGRFSTRIPLWEQALLSANEVISVGLLAYVWSSMLVRVFQPSVFTTQIDVAYSFGLGLATLLYYAGIQFMWVQRWNDWISQNEVWVRLARVLSPFVLFVSTLLIASRFTAQTDPRTASLMDNAELDFAVLALVPVIWVLVLIVVMLVYSGQRGLRQRFLPDELLGHLPGRVGRLFRAISDMDLLLLVGVGTTFIPVYLLFFGDDEGVLGVVRRAILTRGSALVETSEQALAILFVTPFYLFILLLLLLYALIVSRPTLSADERNEMMNRLPVGFLISMVIVLYLFAVPFTQAFTEGRLPTPSRDLGRILAFYILIPLILLYLHFLPLVRFPYGRGQEGWRRQQATLLDADLRDVDRRIRNLNQELKRIDKKWTMTPRSDDAKNQHDRLDTLYRYINLNGERDDLSFRRQEVITARQKLSEISDTPFSVTVARLPLRVISIGIPLLLLFQLYQWAVVSDGLRQVVNDPNLTLIEFIQILLDNIEF